MKIEQVNQQIQSFQGRPHPHTGSLKSGLTCGIFWRQYKLKNFKCSLSQIKTLNYQIKHMELQLAFLLPEADQHLIDCSEVMNIRIDSLTGHDIIILKSGQRLTESEWVSYTRQKEVSL